MRMRHVTPARNLPSILRRGLLAAKSRGALRTCWLCSPSLVPWAILHTARRHGISVDAVAVVEVDVPAGWLTRTGHRGRCHTTGRDIEPARIKGVSTVAQLEAC